LLAPGAELTDHGTADVGGRPGRKIELRLSPSPSAPPPERLAQRKWRESRTIEELSGEVVLDTAKGMVLSGKLAGAVGFTGDGRRMTMKVSLDGALAGIGKSTAIAVPPRSEVVATPERLREVDERDFLLQRIAPPLRRSPDAPAAAPDKPAATPDKPAPAPDKPAPNKPAPAPDKPKPAKTAPDKPKPAPPAPSGEKLEKP